MNGKVTNVVNTSARECKKRKRKKNAVWLGPGENVVTKGSSVLMLHGRWRVVRMLRGVVVDAKQDYAIKFYAIITSCLFYKPNADAGRESDERLSGARRPTSATSFFKSRWFVSRTRKQGSQMRKWQNVHAQRSSALALLHVWHVSGYCRFARRFMVACF